MPCTLSVRRWKRNAGAKESLNETTDGRRIDVEGERREKKRSGETTCAELLGDGVDEAVNLVEPEDDVVVMGKVAVFLFAVAVTCGVYR